MRLSRRAGLLALVLIVSVAINLFLAGNQLGSWLHRRPPMNFEQRVEMLVRNLPDEDRTKAHEILEAHRQDLEDKFHLYRVSAQAAGAAIHAEPYNADEARSAFAKANDRLAEFRQAVQDVVIEIAGKISDKGREHLHAGIVGS